jgi:hypothetical protein
MDGSPSVGAPIELEGVERPVVVARVQALGLDGAARRSSARSCMRAWRDDVRATPPVVWRLGAHAETVTFRDVSGRWLVGCDDAAGPREDARRWCGSAVGRLWAGRLRDPRVDVGGCTTAAGEHVGFAWIEPGADTRYVVVGQPGYAEAYEVAGDVPVRIATTSGVIVDRSRARFELSEHDAAGRLIREYELEAGVAG